MTIPLTLKKLDQVHYHLEAMRKAAKATPVQVQAFEHALSAFLQAGRNVTFSLEAEAKTEKDAWFPIWIDSLTARDRELLELMNAQRVADVHQGGAMTSQTTQYIPAISVQIPKHPHLISGTIGPPELGAASVGHVVHYFDDRKPEQVLPRCRRYAKLLQKLVADFLKGHPQHKK